jgi:hypothetical protein
MGYQPATQTRTSEATWQKSAATSIKPLLSTGAPVHPILQLQQTIGNRAVNRLIQAKLKIGQPGDRYEQEADRVADLVMRMPRPRLQRQAEPEEEEERLRTKPLVGQITRLVQRQVEPEEEKEEEEPIQAKQADGALLQRQEEPEEEEEEKTLQAKPLAVQISPLVQREVELEEGEEVVQTKPLLGQMAPVIHRQVEPEEEEEEEIIQAKQDPDWSATVTPNLAARIQSLGGGGQPLPASARAFFEPRFGYDFRQVRVHRDAQAAGLAQELEARAFTVGRDVVFGAEQYAPATMAGRRLIAHELTHVIQQAGSDGIGTMTMSHLQSKKKQRKAKRFRPRIRWGGISYRRLLKDKKLEIGVAIGYSFMDEYRRLVDYLEDKKFHRLGSPLLEFFRLIGNLIPIVQWYLKKGVERWQKIKRFWLRLRKRKKKKPVDVEVIIDVINQESKDPKKHFQEFLSSKEIAVYSGHARYGTGPDFDPGTSVKENFIIGINSALHKTGRLAKGYNPQVNKALQDRANDLEAMSKAGQFDPKLYQVWFFNACKTISYLDEIRGGLVKGKSRTNLRVVGATRGMYSDAIPFIDGILKQQSMKQILRHLNRAETEYRKSEGEKTYRSYYFSD